MVHGNASLEIIADAFTPMLVGADPLQSRIIEDRLFHEHIKVGPEGAYAGRWRPSTQRDGVLDSPRGNGSAHRGLINLEEVALGPIRRRFEMDRDRFDRGHAYSPLTSEG